MSTSTETVFSEFECDLMNFKIAETDYEIKCIGSVEESNEVRNVTKKCRGVVTKKRTYGTGTGTLKLTAHMPYEAYNAIHAMNSEKLAEGVKGYGRDSLHPEFPITAHIKDEDGIEKYKAWPICTASTGPARKIENGAEEVAEVELEIGFTSDENGFGFYEALASDITELKDQWMKNFTPDLVIASA
ncbi:MAG: hypothetical protein ACI4BI_01815 [Anaerotardibacter sp.]